MTTVSHASCILISIDTSIPLLTKKSKFVSEQLVPGSQELSMKHKLGLAAFGELLQPWENLGNSFKTQTKL